MNGMDLLRCCFLFFIFYMDFVFSSGCGKLQPADIGFLIDESGSVGHHNFQKNLQFVTKFVDLFEIGDNGVKISAFAFDHTDVHGFHFSCCKDKSSVKNEVKNISFNGGGENFEMALGFARNSMFQKSNGARDATLKILFFFTDGQSQVQNGGDLLRQQGVIVYAVGVGSGVNSIQLHQIATNNSYVYMVSNYSALIGSVFDALATKTCNEILKNPCERTPRPCIHGDCVQTIGTNYICICDEGYTGLNCEIDIDYCVGVECHNGGTCMDGLTDYTCHCPNRFTGRHCDIDMCIPFPSDVVFVIDSSTSVGDKFFNMSKETIKRVTKQWQISANLLQVAIVSYTESTKIELDFDTNMNNDKFDNFVEQLKLDGGTSAIQNGVFLARNILNNRNRLVGQTPVRKFIILLSDGLPSTPGQIYMTGEDINIYAVAIGEDVSHYWLSQLVGSIHSVFPYNNDKLWNYMVNELVNTSCNVCQASDENDLIIAVDTSNSSTHTDLTNTIPSILNKLLSGITLGPSKTKVSMMTFSAKPKIMFDFSEFNETNRNDMQRQLSFFTQISETGMNMTALLDSVFNLIHDTLKGARTLAKKKLIIISRFSEHLSLDDELMINNLKSADIEIFTIGLHNTDHEFNVMSTMASTAFHIGTNGDFTFNSIDTFVSSLHEQLPTLTCKLE